MFNLFVLVIPFHSPSVGSLSEVRGIVPAVGTNVTSFHHLDVVAARSRRFTGRRKTISSGVVGIIVVNFITHTLEETQCARWS